MKSEDTLDWYPAQLPLVKIILGEAVLAVGKQEGQSTLEPYLSIFKLCRLSKKNGMIKLPCRPRLKFLGTINALTAGVNAFFRDCQF